MFLADQHIHSKYSRATSRDCTPEALELWARKKGLDLIGSGDFSHPAWRQELAEKLVPAEDGFYTLKEDYRLAEPGANAAARPRFVLSGEISSIYKKNGRTRKIHNVILLPSLASAQHLATRLEAIGNLHSDGRPILGLDSRDLLEITLEVEPRAIFIPAHIWTPHFSLFGAFSGFDTIEECFEDMTPYIHALETGLSSDPPMNWRLSALDGYTLVSNSDAHSPSKLGREATLFCGEFSYDGLAQALQKRETYGGTIEFFPEEGKYHLDGHRNCKCSLTPPETLAAGGRCPVCGGKITIGVLHRVEELADRPASYHPKQAVPFESLVPLPEAIAASTGYTPISRRVQAQYEDMLARLGSEFHILRHCPIEDIRHTAGPCIAEGIRRVRQGEITAIPGYDGEYGKIQILDEATIAALSGQLALFPAYTGKKASSAKPIPSAATSSPSTTTSQDALTHVPTLNEAQLAAVTAIGDIAVIAGPGTGKTKTLTARIAQLLADGTPPREMTAVTFTNQAATELRNRLNQQSGTKSNLKGLTIGTFHSICLEHLRQAGKEPLIIDEFAALTLAEEALTNTMQQGSPQKLLQKVSQRKNGLPVDLDDDLFQYYNQLLATAGVLDYDDILLAGLALWEQPESVPAKVRRSLRYLFVDEFQDVNDLQFRLLQAWRKQGESLFVIGDPDQAIYGFRGAVPACFKRLAEELPYLSTIRLTQNYRSTPEILSVALPLLTAVDGDCSRTLTAQKPTGPAVRLLNIDDDFSEAVFLAKEINRMVGGVDMLDAALFAPAQIGTRSFSDIAVLYRTHRQAEVLEKCFRQEGIPYLVAGRDKVLADGTVRGLLAFFRYLTKPTDSFSLALALKELWHCPQELYQAARRAVTATTREQGDLPDLLTHSPLYQQVVTLAQTYAPRLTKEKPAKLLTAFLQDAGFAQTPSLDRLLQIALCYPSTTDFLFNLSLGQERDVNRAGGKRYLADAVTLLTCHGAKGLEFPVVFVAGVKNGLLPLDAPGRSADPAEERRLFYVALTRAQEELILLTGPQPSLFLADLPSDQLQKGQATPLRRPSGRQLSFF